MFWNFFKTAYRNFLRFKGYSFINLTGLVVGFVISIILFLWVSNELNFDRFNKNYDNIHRLCVDLKSGSHMIFPMIMPAAAELLKQDYPEVEDVVRIQRPFRANVTHNGEKLMQKGVCYADNSLFSIFSFPLVSGEPEELLNLPYTAVISESMAEKYFPGENPVGSVLKIEGQEFTITGLMKDIPHDSHFRFNIACSFETLYAEDRVAMENWFHIQFYTYLLLKKGSDASDFEKKLPGFVDKYMKEVLEGAGLSLRLFTQPLADIHLYSDLGGEIAPQGNIQYVYLFAGIAVFVLLIACINFINLSTARSVIRALEIGMRKTLGADNNLVRVQFLMESFFYCLFAMVLSIVIIIFLVPLLEQVYNTTFGLKELTGFTMIFLVIATTLLTGLLAGSYPAFYLSRIKPALAVKGGTTSGYKRSAFRNGLVVFQFVISIILITATIAIFNQISYMKGKSPGFNKENLLVIPGAKKLLKEYSLTTVRHLFSSVPGVLSIGGSSLVPGRGTQGAIMYPEGFSDSQPQMGEKLFIDENYLPALGIKIIEGRNFSRDYGSDPENSVLINRSAADKFGWKEAVGKTFIYPGSKSADSQGRKMSVVGVVSDFHSASMHRQIKPLILYNDIGRINFFVLKIKSENLPETIGQLQKSWDKLLPDLAFDFFFLDDTFDRMYRNEEQFAGITLMFCLFTIFISCLGLFGLAAFMAARRTKEIGVRKTLGATVYNLVFMLTGDFSRWAVLANVIAWPLSYYIINIWLENFAYRIELSILPFIFAALISFTISVLTVVFQAVRAASVNPVESLRYE